MLLNWAPNFFVRGPHKLLYKFEGRTSYVMWLFRDNGHMLHSAKSTNLYFFNYWQNVFATSWNSFTGRMKWLRGPHLARGP